MEEIAKGVDKKVKVRRKIQAEGVTYTTCSTCNGQGQVNACYQYLCWVECKLQLLVLHVMGLEKSISSKPKDADAQGLIVTEETVTINIPEGVTEGVQLKVGRKRK